MLGDFLFAQSSWFLANLNNLEVRAKPHIVLLSDLHALFHVPWWLHSVSPPLFTALHRHRSEVSQSVACQNTNL